MIVDTAASGGIAAPRRRAPLKAKVAALLVACVFAIGFVEGAVRLRQYLRYGAGGNATYKTMVDPATGLVIPSPNQSTRTIRIDSRGFRSPELRMPKPPGVIRIAFLGASTTFCAEVSSNEMTWPHLVWMKAREANPGFDIDYLNASMPGYTVSNTLRNLRGRVAPVSPDIIVIYEGINDLSRDARELAERQGIQRGSVDDESGLGRWLLTWSLVEKNLRLMNRQKAASSGAARLVQLDAEALAAPFRSRFRELVKEAQKLTPAVAVVTISQKVRREQDPATQLHNANTHLYYMPYMGVENLIKGFDEYNRVIREVASETGAVLVGNEDAIPADDLNFNDSVHFRDAGSRAMADRVSAAMPRLIGLARRPAGANPSQ